MVTISVQLPAIVGSAAVCHNAMHALHIMHFASRADIS
jgi:hypothetical protein